MNNKYTIDWQTSRILLKLTKDLDKKISFAFAIGDEYVKENNNSIQSLVNWVDGIAIVYKNTSYYSKLMDIKNKFKDYSFQDKEISTTEDIANCNFSDVQISIMRSLNKKKEDVISNVLKDNLTRSNKWLRSFYNHKGLNAFIDNLYEVHPSCNSLYLKNLDLRKEAAGKKSSWSFVY